MSERLSLAVPEIPENNPEFVQLLETSRHESGHEMVAKFCGWAVTKVSVEAEGNILGFTQVSPPNKNPEDLLIDYAAICLGGQIAAQKMGDYTDGCSSDLAKAQALASIATQLGIDEVTFWRSAYNCARAALANFSTSAVEKNAEGHAASIKKAA